MFRVARWVEPAHRGGLVLGWILDVFRILWGFLYWNSRKTLFRLRRREGTCPCQNLSDSGKAGETGCDPSLTFHKPARFRTVCPLLQPNSAGLLMCSVDTGDVRPFWGRVALAGLVAALVVYAAGVLTVFGVMRKVGYPVTVTMIGWPPAWSSIDQARSAYFLQNAQEAFARNDLSTTVMSLSLAYDYDPENYDAGFFLARLWQASRPEISNRIYQELVLNHPDKRTETSQAWLRSLLPRADYEWIERLAASALRFSDDHASAWLHALLFANTRTQNDATFARLLESPDTLTPGVETVLKLEESVRQFPPDLASKFLQRPLPEEVPNFVLYYQVRRLIDLGFAVEALEVLNRHETRFSDRDRITLQLRALADAEFERSYIGLFDRLTRLAASPAQIDIIAAHLVSHPNALLYRQAKSRLKLGSLTDDNGRLAAAMALFCMAGAHGDTAFQLELAQIMREITGSRFAILDPAIAVMSRADTSGVRIERILPSLQPLSLDLTYAILERYEIVGFDINDT
jgi:hypothetical protein